MKYQACRPKPLILPVDENLAPKKPVKERRLLGVGLGFRVPEKVCIARTPTPSQYPVNYRNTIPNRIYKYDRDSLLR